MLFSHSASAFRQIRSSAPVSGRAFFRRRGENFFTAPVKMLLTAGQKADKMLYIGLYESQQFLKGSKDQTERECGMEKIWIGLEIRSLNNLICRYFEFSSHRKEIETVTGNNGWIIGYLAENKKKDIFQKDLEDHFSITRSTASKVLILMEQKGLILRQAVEQDARLKKLVLTEKAWKIHDLMKEDAIKMEQTLTEGLTDEEMHVLLLSIKKMRANISGVKPGADCADHT